MQDTLETSLTVTSHDLSIWGLFLAADIVVKAVMLMLILASIWSWAIFFEKLRYIGREYRLADDFEDEFWSGGALDRLYDQLGADPDGTMPRVFSAAMREWRRATSRGVGSKESIHSLSQRIERTMSVTISRELSAVEKGMTFLASVGAVAQDVGLFGTVWGIMNSFQSIAQSKNTSLAVVAPGIAEALFATALGLAAAIPAVVAYNRFSSQIEGLASRLETFSGEFSTILSRQLDER
ncbi:MAG: protein TolQ [Alphaproteobacteria bacterium]|nr:protein TolQ [Alphaproteobacteria bacterium]